MTTIRPEWTNLKARKSLIIADAGGTKTEWWILPKDSDSEFIFETDGINASVSKDKSIFISFSQLKNHLTEIGMGSLDNTSVFFFGAGCVTEVSNQRLSDIFFTVFQGWDLSLEIDSDLLGASVALYGDSAGIACILGTGSASCLYNGIKIIDSVPSLGFILGDEGSGASFGKSLLNKYFKRELDSNLCAQLEQFDDVSLPVVLDKIYRQSNANKYLSSFMPFILTHKEYDDISIILEEGLKLFFEKNVLKYNYPEGAKIRFVGGVACELTQEIYEVSSHYGLVADCFLKKPIIALGNFYKQKLLYDL